MNVYLVCNTVDVLGGVQTWVRVMARLFADNGHRVHVVGIARRKRAHQHATAFDCPVTTLHPGTPDGDWGFGWTPKAWRGRAERWRGVRDLADVLRPGGVAIVAEVWAMEWVKRAAPDGVRVVGMVHESYAAARGAGRHPRIMKHFAGADRLLALTRADADAFARDGLTNVDHLPNPLHVYPDTPAPLTDPVVVRLGRLDYDKGQDLLLEAWAMVGRPGWTLRVHGSGKEAAALARRTERLGLTGSVQWPGPTSDVDAALRAGSIFALTSREEGFPLSIMEAMAYGLPCVAFDCAPGIRELITHGDDGLVVEAGNTGAFAAALRTLIDDLPLRRRMGAAARASVRRFAPEVVYGRWTELFAQLNR